MRTTLTLDDELAEELKRLARTSGRSFKEVVNTAIRRGLSVGEEPAGAPEPFRVEPKACGFRTGIDPTKLNQLYDELEAAEAARAPEAGSDVIPSNVEGSRREGP